MPNPNIYQRAIARSCACGTACSCDAAEQGCLCGVSPPRAPRASSSASLRRALLGTVAALAVVGVVAACSQPASKPDQLDYASTRLSEQGAYRVSYRSETAPIPINRIHSWTLHVEAADGRPVTDAAVTVDGDMPEHRHGLPTRPRVTRNLGNGDYLVEGVKFQMGGWWVMEFTVAAGGRSDVAKFNLNLPS
jgi:hypothetical protein